MKEEAGDGHQAAVPLMAMGGQGEVNKLGAPERVGPAVRSTFTYGRSER